MKKWTRPFLIGMVAIGLVYGGLYEYATHVGRGWLRGEAFYEGRPTSYWQARIHGWMDRFDTPDKAVEYASLSIQFTGIAFFPTKGPRPTLWGKLRLWKPGLRFIPDDGLPPSVLFCDADAESVLCELENEPEFETLVKAARDSAQGRKTLEELLR
jgi:hypothetical protein